MVFSFFGRKPAKKKPEKPPVKKVEARKPADPPVPKAESAQEDLSLDFTNYVPPAPAHESAAPASPVPAPAAEPIEDPASLDFGTLAADATSRSALSETPSAFSTAASEPQSVARYAGSRKATELAHDALLFSQGEEALGFEIPAALEEAAVLFANGQTEEALACLRKALEFEDLGGWQLQTWLMIFDLLQHLRPQAGV